MYIEFPAAVPEIPVSDLRRPLHITKTFLASLLIGVVTLEE